MNARGKTHARTRIEEIDTNTFLRNQPQQNRFLSYGSIEQIFTRIVVEW